nr:C-type lectin domain family 12 member B isoform X1 [Nothobranchius furzeri]
MTDNEINYASVVIHSKKESQLEAPRENIIYDEVKTQNATMQQTDHAKDPGKLQTEKETKGKCWNYQLLAAGFGTLCVFLTLSIIGICVHFSALYEGEKTKQARLLEENHKLRSDNGNLTSGYYNLTILYNNLTEQIHNNLNDLNVTRAQWSVDAYCPKVNARKCSPCQEGWKPYQSSCYAYNNAEPARQRTWAGARDDCRGKSSDLTVVADEQERNYVFTISVPETGITGFWIGLRAVNGTWKWIDGTDLTNQGWVDYPAAEGLCVTSLKVSGDKWISKSCNTTNAWICEKKALSV